MKDVTSKDIEIVLTKTPNGRLKAKEIAEILGVEKRFVNSVLYRYSSKFEKNEDYEWTVVKQKVEEKKTQKKEYQLMDLIYVPGTDHYKNNIDYLLNGNKKSDFTYDGLKCKLIIDNTDSFYPTAIKLVGFNEEKYRIIGLIPLNFSHEYEKYIDCDGIVIARIEKCRGNYKVSMKIVPEVSSIGENSKINEPQSNSSNSLGVIIDESTKTDDPSSEDAVGIEIVEEKAIEIEEKDFVIRRNTFHCLHGDHDHEKIVAIINVMAKSGTVYPREIPAAYCPQCNQYFIMENTFRRLKRIGILLCRVSDEKTYIKNNGVFGFDDLPPESLLKQYGYNVAQDNEMTAEQRCKILEKIIDSGICSRETVISYLEYFINMHKNRKTTSYDEAISKWENDRDYIEKYKANIGTRIRVNSIKR